MDKVKAATPAEASGVSVKEPVDVERLRELARRHDLLKPNVVAWLDDLDENAERETALPAEEAPVHGRDKDGEEL